jgi:NitT/TauT family transport system permease protein
VVTVAVTSFFLVALTTTHGVRQIDRLVLEAAVHYGARGWRLFLTVLLPGALPFIFTGLRLGLGYALIVAVAVEIVAANRGLGAFLWLSWQVLKVEDMYAGFVVIAALGAVLSYGLAALRGRLLPWVEDVSRR